MQTATRRGTRSSYWAWPGPAGLYLIAIFAALWLVIAMVGAKSQFVMASATALAICAGLACYAAWGNLDKWNRWNAWVVRIGAAATGVWLFLAPPALWDRCIAAAVFATVYVLCERAVWRIELRHNSAQ